MTTPVMGLFNTFTVRYSRLSSSFSSCAESQNEVVVVCGEIRRGWWGLR